jgi:UDP-N-acetylglucosamine 4,6-dehydratase
MDPSALQNSVVLITGGTGSFGKTMAQHLLARQCGEVRIFSRDEEKQETMRLDQADPRLRFVIGDVRDTAAVDAVMQDVDLVFHAAALKQVPSCEFFPMEAVRTNIVGSSNVIESALRHAVRSVVCLGTDKAVYPVNTMGMTKAIMEKVVQSVARRLRSAETVVSSVRYGNVMYSRGSVIPLFVKQILAGKALTMTHPAMTRFLLPLTAAVELVEFAFSNARQGDIFIKKAPACTIADLGQALSELFGVEHRVEQVGIRHGEKMHETLASAEELRRAQDMGDYYRVPLDARDLNYNLYFTEGDRVDEDAPDYTSATTERLDVAHVKTLLLSLPEIQTALELGREPAASARQP